MDGTATDGTLLHASNLAGHALELAVGLVAAWCVTVWSRPIHNSSGNSSNNRNNHRQGGLDESVFAACLMGGTVCGEAFCVVLKRMVRQRRPSPMLCGKNDEGGDFGMPSSHAEVAFFLLTYLACAQCGRQLAHLRRTRAQQQQDRLCSGVRHVLAWTARVAAVVGSALVAALAIAASRVPLGCHTSTQVAAGALLGLAQGLLWWFAVQPWLASVPRLTRALVRLLHWAVPPHTARARLAVAQLAVLAVVTLFSREPSRFLRFLFLRGRYAFVTDALLLAFTLLFALLVPRVPLPDLWPPLLAVLAVCFVLHRHFAVACDLSTVAAVFAAVVAALAVATTVRRHLRASQHPQRRPTGSVLRALTPPISSSSSSSSL